MAAVTIGPGLRSDSNGLILKIAVQKNQPIYELLDVRRLERLRANSPEALINDLRHVHQCGGVEDAVRAAKMAGIFVDLDGSARNKKLAGKALNELGRLAGRHHPAVRRLKADAELLNDVFRGLFRTRAYSRRTTRPDPSEASAFLVATEVWLGATRMLFAKQDVAAVANVYPFLLYPDLAPEDNLADAFGQFMRQADSVAQLASTVFKYLLHIGSPAPLLNAQIMPESLQAARAHVLLVDKWRHFETLAEFWEFFDAHLERDRGRIKYVVDDVSAFDEWHISRQRFEARQAAVMALVVRAPEDTFDPHTIALPPEGYRSHMELVSEHFVSEVFGSRSLDRLCNGCTLNQWIRAYQLIAEECLRAIQKREDRGVMPGLQLSEWCIARPAEQWSSLLAEGGIPGEQALRIVKALTFRDRAADFQDCPLIPIGDDLCVLPSIGATIAPALAMLSNFSRLGLDVDFKGAGLEDTIRDAVRSGGIRCEQVSVSARGDTFEVDAAFILDDDLYLVEVKSIAQPFDPRGLRLFHQQRHQFAAQHNRTCDYFERNLPFIKRALSLSREWMPKQVFRLIVCSTLLGAPVAVDGCRLIDASAFSRYWERRPLSINMGDKALVVGGAETHLGSATSETLQAVLKDPPQISLTRATLSVQTVTDNLHGFRVDVPIVRPMIDSLALPGSRTYKTFEGIFESALLSETDSGGPGHGSKP